MSTVEKSIDVQVPVRTAYDQWTQFESFPQFMEGVDEVRQTDETMTRWRTKVGGVQREFDAKITEQHPDERVAWRSTDGSSHGGVVTFHRLSADTTRVTVQMDFHPAGFVEKAGDALGVLDRRVKGDLQRFKEFIENRGNQTGGWRGDVPSGGIGHGADRATGYGSGRTAGYGADPGATVYDEPGPARGHLNRDSGADGDPPSPWSGR